ncbi:MAG TPA: cytochrome D1 domain-containing protein [Aquabacterium sp.]|nr:cytochrome D1 domain-containing protein [Aquabacterium sp.]HEX5374208.1 cytochrome D1 domain-containing protein [Aquabacterium sp.]
MFMGYDLSRAQSASPPPQELFARHCAACHGVQRQGQMGPALLPESLERLRRGDARDVILKGRTATQMPAFGEQLSPTEVDSLVQWIYTPSSPRPTWSESDIRASRTELVDVRKLPSRPQWKADPLNLFVVVEGGDHHVSIVDGDRFDVIHRFASRFALHGGPKFSPDGRFVYFGSRDGWITKYDLYNLRVVAEVRAGLNMRNVAVSGDGRWVLAGNYLPHTVALFDSDLQLVRTLTAGLLDGRATSRVSAVYDAAPRQSFIVALKDIPELWEISYNPRAEPIHDGYVHDFRMGEAIASPGFLGVRRTPLSEPLDDFFFDPPYRHVIGATRPRTSQEGESAPTAQVINLDARQRIATLPLPGMPHLGSGITFSHQGRSVLATPNLQQGLISVIDLQNWRLIKQIPTPGPGFFMRSHEHSPYAWTDAMMSPQARNILSVIDKNTLEVVAQLKAPEGQTLAHIEFTRDGRYALASLWEKDGALIVYDARSLKEVKRLPMSKPVGKYNVWNKISRSEGTSH